MGIAERGLSGSGPNPPDRSTLLIVEDEPRLRESLALLLAEPGREIRTAESVAAAIGSLASAPADVVLLDLRLPDGSGLDVLGWLEGERQRPLVIVLSADDSIDAAIGALRHGAFDFVRKPYQIEDLRNKVSRALRERALEISNARMASQLKDSERIHRSLVENSPDVIYTLDPDGRFSFVNSRIESLLGYTRSELSGEHYSMLVCEEDLERARHVFNERRTGPRASRNVELKLKRRADGCEGDPEDAPSFITAELNATGLYTEPATPEERQRFLGTYGVARDVSDRKKVEELVDFQAYHDPLTHLPNRALFRDRLGLAMAQAVRSRCMVAVMFIDLDRFKLVNDTFGHTEGDELLRSVSTRIRSCLRRGDTLARLGGDKFVMMLPDLARAEDAAVIVEKIRDALQHPFAVGSQEFRATASIGIALFPQHGEDVDQLVKHADTAMCHVKARGKNAFCFFSPEMSGAFQEKLAFENDMRRALDEREFELHYQPVIDVRTGRAVAMEALLRWRHPDHGVLIPSRFISLAEESGLIFPVTDWVLSSALSQAAAWRAQGHAGLRVAVNLSARDFEKIDVVDRVARAIEAARVGPGVLEIEITEGMLLADAEGTLAKVGRLHDHGIRVVIDDFGTRYSSLSYLSRFSVAALKVDQRFVRELSRDAGTSPIVSAIAAIASGFGLELIAEGVETPDQRDLLADLGCRLMQGYHFSDPMPVAVATEFLRARQAVPAGTNG